MPSLRARATVLAYRASVAGRADELGARVDVMAAAAAELHASARLRQLRACAAALVGRLEGGTPAAVAAAPVPAGNGTEEATPQHNRAVPAPMGLLTLVALKSVTSPGGGGGSSGGGDCPTMFHLVVRELEGGAADAGAHADVLLLGSVTEPLVRIGDAVRIAAGLNSLAVDLAALVKERAEATAAGSALGLGDVHADGMSPDETVAAPPPTDASPSIFLHWAAARLRLLEARHAEARVALMAALQPSDDAERRAAEQCGSALTAVWQLMQLMQRVRTVVRRPKAAGAR